MTYCSVHRTLHPLRPIQKASYTRRCHWLVNMWRRLQGVHNLNKLQYPISPFKPQGTSQKREKECKNQRESMVSQKKIPNIFWKKNKKVAHFNSQWLRQHSYIRSMQVQVRKSPRKDSGKFPFRFLIYLYTYLFIYILIFIWVSV